MIKANKRLGQNFLRDEKILQKIVDFAQIEKGDVVLEVGPGEGTLTKLLLKKAGKVIAVEKDEHLAELLQVKFAPEIKDKRLRIIIGDALELEAESLELGGEEKDLNSKLKPLSYKLVGNIPYYITGEIFRKFLESSNQPKSLTFVVQKEVADRIMARDGKESILSLSIKAYGRPEYGGIIKAGSFAPRPKVDSAIIAVRGIGKKKFFERALRRPTGRAEEKASRLLSVQSEKNFFLLEKKFFEIVKKGFAHKRKLLAKNLGIDQSILLGLGIKEKARAEDLKLEDWLKILHHPQKK